ncbi:MAG: hypothetical protein LBB47_00930 [Spirochaetaceae bacterium]|jgi:hypothetical protein|nr:hypothetical protein [Spirochaetaceae bacterium]
MEVGAEAEVSKQLYYDNIMVEDEVNAVKQGELCPATKRESMAVRLA